MGEVGEVYVPNGGIAMFYCDVRQDGFVAYGEVYASNGGLAMFYCDVRHDEFVICFLVVTLGD